MLLPSRTMLIPKCLLRSGSYVCDILLVVIPHLYQSLPPVSTSRPTKTKPKKITTHVGRRLPLWSGCSTPTLSYPNCSMPTSPRSLSKSLFCLLSLGLIDIDTHPSLPYCGVAAEEENLYELHKKKLVL